MGYSPYQYAETHANRNELPAWYTQYGQTLTGTGLDLYNRAGIANYQGYSTNGYWNPTVAGMSGAENSAYSQAMQGNLGGWSSMLNSSNNTLNAGAGYASAASPDFNRASSTIGSATGDFGTARNQIGSATGNFNTSQNQVNSATGAFDSAMGMYHTAGGDYGKASGGLSQAGSVINGGLPHLNYSTGNLNWGSGNLGYASDLADHAATSLYGNQQNQNQFNAYMNPYRTEVAEEIGRLANQNLFENVVPNINSTFVGNGQFGSTRNGTFMNQAVRDNQATVSGAQSQVLLAAVNEAMKNYQTEKGRELQGAQTQGALSQVAAQIASGHTANANANTAIGQALNQNAMGFTDLGQARTNTGLAQTTTGNARVNQGLASKAIGDSRVQQGNASRMVGDSIVNQGNALTNVGLGRVQQGATVGNIGAQIGANAARANAAKINDINALLGVGGLERGIRQHQLDSDLALWQDWRDHPYQALGALSQILPNVSGRIMPDQIGSKGYLPQSSTVYDNLQQIINAINGRS